MCACCSRRWLPETVDVAQAVCDVFTVSPHSGKTKVSNGGGCLGSLLMIDVNLYCCSFFKRYFADWLKDSVFEFCFNNHNLYASLLNARSWIQTGQARYRTLLQKSTQRLLQLRCRISFFIAILHDHRSVKRQSPFASCLGLSSPRTWYNHSACGDFDRFLPA